MAATGAELLAQALLVARETRRSLDLIGEGEWTPQDMRAGQLCEAVEALADLVPLTADEAEKVREALEVWAVAHHLSGHEVEVRTEAFTLLSPAGKDET